MGTTREWYSVSHCLARQFAQASTLEAPSKGRASSFSGEIEASPGRKPKLHEGSKEAPSQAGVLIEELVWKVEMA